MADTLDLIALRNYIDGLSELVAFLEAHPDLPCPIGGISSSASHHVVYVATKDELVRFARTAGAKWEKDFQSDTYFSLKLRFAGGAVYELYTERAKVCRKEVIGTRIEPATPEREVEDYRWICDEPLLAGGAQ